MCSPRFHCPLFIDSTSVSGLLSKLWHLSAFDQSEWSTPKNPANQFSGTLTGLRSLSQQTLDFKERLCTGPS